MTPDEITKAIEDLAPWVEAGTAVAALTTALEAMRTVQAAQQAGSVVEAALRVYMRAASNQSWPDDLRDRFGGEALDILRKNMSAALTAAGIKAAEIERERPDGGIVKRLADQAGLIRLMDQEANRERPTQTNEATAKLLDRAAELIDKYVWQVRDTCTRAEVAEARIAEMEREHIPELLKGLCRRNDNCWSHADGHDLCPTPADCIDWKAFTDEADELIDRAETAEARIANLEVRLQAVTAQRDRDIDSGREWMRRAWHELNAIKARSGAPEGVAETWWAELTDALGALLGDDTKPWMLSAAGKLVEPYETRIAELEREGSALAANQCHDGYAGEHGHHMCRYQARVAELERALSIALHGLDQISYDKSPERFPEPSYELAKRKAAEARAAAIRARGETT